MARISRSGMSISAPQSEAEGAHKGVTKCPECGNVHFQKRWLASEEVLKSHLKVASLDIAETKLCQACEMIKNGDFAGELFLEAFPEPQKVDLLNLVHNFGEQATKNDPQHRIIAVEEIKNGHRVTTTENQMAQKLAKKIKDAFKTAVVDISFSREPENLERIYVTFQEK